jgi:hypothetical protein
MNAEDILKFMLSDFARKGVFDEILDEAVDWKGPPELVSLMQAHVAAPPVAPNIQDGFIHYQLIPFCQATRLQYLNGHIRPHTRTKTCSSSTLTTRSPMRS